MAMWLRWMLGLWVVLGVAGCDKLFGGGEEPPPSRPAPATPKWAKDNPTHGNDNTPRLRLETTPGSTVSVYANSSYYSCSLSPSYTATADESGVALVEVTVGDNSSTVFHAKARLEGKDSGCSSFFSYTEDSTPPTRPTWDTQLPKVGTANQLTLEGRAQEAHAITVHASADCSGHTPILAGSSQGNAVRALVFDNSGCDGEPLSTVNVDANGKFQLQVQVPDDSTSRFYVELVDAAGNWSSCKAAPAYVEDSTSPRAPTKVALRSGAMGTSRGVAITGEGPSSERALLFTTPDCQGEPVDDAGISSATFQLDATAAENTTTTFSVAVRDAAGNRSGCVGPLTYLHDALAPSTVGAAVVDGPAEDLAHQRTGSVVEAHWSGFTDANGPLAYFHFLTAQGDCGADEKVTPKTRVEGTAVRLTGLSLPEGTYHHCVQASDGVGNSSGLVRSNGFRVDLTPPAVARSVPAEGEEAVDVLAPLILTFSEPMALASLTANTLTVEAGGARVEGTLSCERDTCTFRPLRPLPYRESVRVMVSTAARDVAGWALVSAHTLGFTTRGRQWSASPGLVQTARPGLVPDVAVDRQGGALAVWVQGGADGTFRPYAARRPPHGAWSAPQPLDTLHPGEAERPVVAVNAAGHAVAVWELRAGADTSLYAAEYAPESGWGAPRLMEQEAAPVGLARVAVDGQGHALVVFQRRDGAQASVWAVRRVAGVGWGSPLLLEASAAPVAPALAAEGGGGALAAWVAVEAGGTRSVRASRFSPGGGWTAAEGVAALADEAAPSVAVSADGSAAVVFRRSSAEGARSILASRYVPGTGWEAESLLGGGATTLTETAVAMDRWGRVLAAWTAQGASAPVLRLARYTRETGWQAVEVATGHASQPAVAADGQGTFHAVWVENTAGEDRVWAARYPEGATALGLARVLEPAHGGTSKRPRVAASAGTGAATVWYRDNGEGFSSNLVYASAYE